MIALQMVRANFKGAMVMVIGENILRTRKNKGLTQTELAEMVGVSFQAVSSWERDEYLPDMENFIKLAELLGVKASYLLGEDATQDKCKFEVLRPKLFDENNMYTFVKSRAVGMNMTETLKALPYMRDKHKGQTRKSNNGEAVPYINHPLTMACNALALGIGEDNLVAALLLHDVVEDCGVAVDDLPVNDEVKKTVVAVTKTKAHKEEGDMSRVKNEKLDSYYAGISRCHDAMMVKLLDRLNNISGMAMGFTAKRMAEYIEETEHYIIPMIDKLRSECPQYANAAFLIKYHMMSIMETVKRIL